MGFCTFGNAAIAAHHARVAGGLERVAIVHWDVHHGNGTQAAFYGDPSVLTISLHQDNCFPPDSGAIDESGEGDGAGYNINVPLPPGSGDGAYVAAFERVVVPALERFRPDLIIVAIVEQLSGFTTDCKDTIRQTFPAHMGQQQLQPHQEALIDSVAERLPAIA